MPHSVLYGINKDFWGRSAWEYMKAVALSYPERPSPDDSARYRAFFLALMDVLPCHNCKDHFARQIAQYPLRDETALLSRRSLIEWLLERENTVRRLQNPGKPDRILAEVVGMYLPESQYGTVQLSDEERALALKNVGTSSASVHVPVSSPLSSPPCPKSAVIGLSIALAVAVAALLAVLFLLYRRK